MAWIESYDGYSMVNLDAVQYMYLDISHPVLWVMVDSINRRVVIAYPETEEIGTTLLRTITGLARGNAVIMQTDVERMMEDARKNAEQRAGEH